MENPNTRKVREYHKFYNVMASILKNLYQSELQFLSQEILQYKLTNELKKQDLIPQIINEIYTNIILKDENSVIFWKIVDYFFKQIKIIPHTPSDESIFKTLNINEISIYHRQENPNHFKKIAKSQRPAIKDRTACVCTSEQKNIRKTYSCSVCQINCHKACLSWQGKDYLCPNCMLDYYNPFFEIQEQIFPECQILIDKEIYQFNIPKEYISNEYNIIIKSIKIETKLNDNYTDNEMKFPQRAVLKINSHTIQKFLPDQNNKPLRRDNIISLTLSSNLNTLLTSGTNSFFCEYDNQLEDFETTKYIFNLYICRKNSRNEIIQRIMKENKHKSLSEEIKNSLDFIKKNFSNFDNSIKMKISLQDPMTAQQIKFPVRGNNCEHLNVFCLESYLMSLEQTEYKKMECPFCKKIISKFLIDFYLIKILFDYQKIIRNINLEQEITFFNDGTYKYHQAPDIPYVSQQSFSSQNSQKKRQQYNQLKIVGDNYDDDSDENYDINNQHQKNQQYQLPGNFLFKRGRGRPPGSKNKTPEERRKQKMDLMMKQAKKIYHNMSMYSGYSQRTFTDEEKKILEALKCLGNIDVPDYILLESYYDTLQLEKRVKGYIDFKQKAAQSSNQFFNNHPKNFKFFFKYFLINQHLLKQK